MTVIVNAGTTTIPASQTITSDGNQLAVYAVSNGATLINQGVMSLTASGPSTITGIAGASSSNPTDLFENDGSFSVSTTGSNYTVGVEPLAVHNFGSFSVTASGGQTIGVESTLVNGGTFTVQGGGQTYGVNTSDTTSVENQAGGTMTVSISGSDIFSIANGVYLGNGGSFVNAGALKVSSLGTAVGVNIVRGDFGTTSPYSTFNNSGTIVVTGPTSIGLALGSAVTTTVPDGQYDIVNSGTITAQTAIEFSSGFSPPTWANFAINNSGTINGNIITGSNPHDRILNTGTINGNVTFGDGNDIFDSSQGVINGSITLGAGNNTVIGGAENDRVIGGSGNNSIDGGGGFNTVSFANANLISFVNTGGDNWTLNTGSATETLTNVQLVNYAQTGVLLGTSGADTLNASAGGNTLIGGGGGDALFGGGLGTYTFKYLAYSDSTAANPDGIFNFHTGANIIDLTLLQPTAVSLVRSGGSTFLFADGAGGHLQINVVGAAANGNDILTGGTNTGGVYLIGDNSGDTLVGSAAGDPIQGGTGNDTITGGGGGDALFSGGGTDTFVYTNFSDSTAAAPDAIFGFVAGQDKIDLTTIRPTSVNLIYSGGSTFLFADTGSSHMQINIVGALLQGGDVATGAFSTGGIGSSAPGVTIIGDNNGDALIGSKNNETLVGGAGNDHLIGNGGADVMTGGGGADTFEIDGLGSGLPGYFSPTDTITDFQTGSDKIFLSPGESLSAVAVTEGVTGSQYSESVSIISSNIYFLNRFISAPNITTLLINGLASSSDFSSNQTMHLTWTIAGSAGADVITADAVGGTITGGGGGDAMFAGAGVDTFAYTAFSDSTAANPDGIFGFVTGQDKIDLSGVGALTALSLVRSGGSTFLFADGAGGHMQINLVNAAVNGSDILTNSGSTGGVYIIGDNAGDTLIGSANGDPIQGGSGNDTIIGGGGGDALFGGAGTNTFKYVAASDSTTSAPDSIFDFKAGTDKIDLSAVRESSTDTYGILSQSGSTFLFIHLDPGQADAHDMTIILNGTASITANDIIWGSAPAGHDVVAVASSDGAYPHAVAVDTGADTTVVSHALQDAGHTGAAAAFMPVTVSDQVSGGVIGLDPMDHYLLNPNAYQHLTALMA